MIKLDNHSSAMTRIENCPKVCCTMQVFFLLLEPVAFIFLFPSLRFFTSWLLELTSSVTTKQFVLCNNFIKKPTMFWKMPNENDIRR